MWIIFMVICICSFCLGCKGQSSGNLKTEQPPLSVTTAIPTTAIPATAEDLGVAMALPTPHCPDTMRLVTPSRREMEKVWNADKGPAEGYTERWMTQRVAMSYCIPDGGKLASRDEVTAP